MRCGEIFSSSNVLHENMKDMKKDTFITFQDGGYWNAWERCFLRRSADMLPPRGPLVLQACYVLHPNKSLLHPTHKSKK